MTRVLACAILTLCLSACAAPQPGQPHPYDGYLDQKGLELPEPDDFQHCRGYGCAIRDRVSLNKKEWKQVEKHFRKIRSPEQERAAIAKAIATLETEVGALTGTSEDIAGTFDKVGKYQLDCVDESTNTTIYLAMLEQKKLLKFHTVSRPTARSPFTSMAGGKFWPHFTAVIYDMKTGTPYAVDSSAGDNGAPPDILAIEDWVYGATMASLNGKKP